MKNPFLLSLFLFAISFQAFTYTVDDVPNPKSNGRGYVSNPEVLISLDVENEINQLLADLEDSSGFQVAVVVLSTIGEEVPKTFAHELFNKWGIGQKETNNGLLILLVMDQRRVEFETGYGTETVLTDALCKRIQMLYMVPKFKEGAYDEGLLEGVKKTINILQNPASIAEMEELAVEDKVEDYSFIQISIIAGLYFLGILIAFLIENNSKRFDPSKLNKKNKKRVPIAIFWWLFIYAFLPLLFFIAFSQFFHTNLAWLWCLVALYCFALFFLIENRIRTAVYSRKNYNPKDYYSNYLTYYENTKKWYWAAIFFPFPFLFYWFYSLGKRKYLRNKPRNCAACGNKMHKLDEKSDDFFLSKRELLEENLHSIDYDVWACKSCEEVQILKYDNAFSKYKECPACSTKSFFLESDVTVESATYSSSGIGKKTYKCKNCGHTKSETYTIPMKVESSSSSSGSSGGSSFGGGSSGGGGSGSSW